MQRISEYSTLFDRMAKFKVRMLGQCSAEATMTIPIGYKLSKHVSWYARGLLAAIPTLWDLPPADVRPLEKGSESEEQCPQGVTHSDSREIKYRVSWQPRLMWFQRLLWILGLTSNDHAGFQVLNEARSNAQSANNTSTGWTDRWGKENPSFSYSPISMAEMRHPVIT